MRPGSSASLELWLRVGHQRSHGETEAGEECGARTLKRSPSPRGSTLSRSRMRAELCRSSSPRSAWSAWQRGAATGSVVNWLLRGISLLFLPLNPVSGPQEASSAPASHPSPGQTPSRLPRFPPDAQREGEGGGGGGGGRDARMYTFTSRRLASGALRSSLDSGSASGPECLVSSLNTKCSSVFELALLVDFTCSARGSGRRTRRQDPEGLERGGGGGGGGALLDPSLLSQSLISLSNGRLTSLSFRRASSWNPRAPELKPPALRKLPAARTILSTARSCLLVRTSPLAAWKSGGEWVPLGNTKVFSSGRKGRRIPRIGGYLPGSA